MSIWKGIGGLLCSNRLQLTKYIRARDPLQYYTNFIWTTEDDRFCKNTFSISTPLHLYSFYAAFVVDLVVPLKQRARHTIESIPTACASDVAHARNIPIVSIKSYKINLQSPVTLLRYVYIYGKKLYARVCIVCERAAIPSLMRVSAQSLRW